jgi:predicted small lipoprotein YifL
MTPRHWAVLIVGLALAGCGKMGPLERPPPLFGKAGPESAAPAPPKHVSTVDPRDRGSADDLPPLSPSGTPQAQ